MVYHAMSTPARSASTAMEGGRPSALRLPTSATATSLYPRVSCSKPRNTAFESDTGSVLSVMDGRAIWLTMNQSESTAGHREFHTVLRRRIRSASIRLLLPVCRALCSCISLYSPMFSLSVSVSNVKPAKILGRDAPAQVVCSHSGAIVDRARSFPTQNPEAAVCTRHLILPSLCVHQLQHHVPVSRHR